MYRYHIPFRVISIISYETENVTFNTSCSTQGPPRPQPEPRVASVGDSEMNIGLAYELILISWVLFILKSLKMFTVNRLVHYGQHFTVNIDHRVKLFLGPVQGHVLWGQWKADEGLIPLYNGVCVIYEVSEYTATENTENCRFPQTTVVRQTSHYRQPREYPQKPCVAGNYSHWTGLHFCR